MDTHNFLAQQFEAERPRLRAIAYRMLGSLAEADDAVQEVWLRLSGFNTGTISNLGGWLTTVIARVCLNMLHARKSRHEEPLETSILETMSNDGDPEQEIELADSVGLALLVVLETLAPAERLAFVLHDIFAMPFDEIAPIVERSPTAARQLASRARRRVRGRAPTQDVDLAANQEMVKAFLAAAREGSFEMLLAMLDPDVVLRLDAQATVVGVAGVRHGAKEVAEEFVEHAQILRFCRMALVDGSVGIIVARHGRLLGVLTLLVREGKITEIVAIADPAHLRQMHLAALDN